MRRSHIIVVVATVSLAGLLPSRAQAKEPPPAAAPLYGESLRPQFHFTAKTNWLNDPNGLVFYGGRYHSFFQHNPSGREWGNMTWGHAVSTDLVHWRQLDDALKPDRLGTIFSGSAAVDWQNTSGFQSGAEKPLVCFFTSAGGTSPESKGQPFTQSLAYSTDGGETWTKYAHNPVLPHVAGENRDPKVIWHAPSKKWVMALYLEGEHYALFSSPNLKKWTRLSDIPAFGSSECPDLFELPLAGAAGETRWIFWGGNNRYLIGRFDGTTFTKESGPHQFEYGKNYYAAQTYSDIPASDGRRIQIAWMRGGKYPGMPFNQQMSFPSALTLETTPDGPRLFRRPVKELTLLHGERHAWHGALHAGDNPLSAAAGELLDLRAELTLGSARRVSLSLRGAELAYDVAKQELSLMGKSAPLPLTEGKLRLQLLVDRSSIEAFGGDGRVSISCCFTPQPENKSFSLAGDGAAVDSIEWFELNSAVPSGS